ncbi:MAG TPA: threonine synthase [Bauldia sp.]|nr:threonine synthase [Bauldia sp.]
MQYVSTRGQAPTLSFADVLMAGLAVDGGLYVPQSWPQVSPATIAGFAGKAYGDVAFDVIAPFLGTDIPAADLRRMIAAAYAGFDDPAIAPLREIEPHFHVLELFHGPTLAFKDVAMQLLAQLMDYVLAKRGNRITIVGATSGDTGAAAIEAFRGHANIDVFILFPEGRVSPFQQRQMTTTAAANVHPIAIKGTFDDCQAILKALFNKRDFREAVSLSGVNSINWARILGQIVYYFTAAAKLGAPGKRVSFTVPTGNFGDVFAGYVAKKMGLPIETLVVATNVNDILARTIATGRYEVRGVHATTSPSMDIQVSSNFERLLFEAYGRDANAVRALMADLAATGAFTIAPTALAAIRADFVAGRANEIEVANTIAHTLNASGFLADPHTAVGLAVARRFAHPHAEMVTLATAHAAKFAEAVKAAAGTEPKLPQGFEPVLTQPERYVGLANSAQAVEDHIRAVSRATAEKV